LKWGKVEPTMEMVTAANTIAKRSLIDQQAGLDLSRV
jgi:hypothetical protein